MVFKKIFFFLLVTFFLLVVILFRTSSCVKEESKNLIKVNIQELQSADAVLVLGARVYRDNRLSPILEDRVKTALQVYRNGKAKKILVSGDHGQKSYDEVNAIKRYLLDKEKVPAEDIFLDHAGFDTYDSLYRAQSVFGVKRITISTQFFHLPRAVYIAKKLGLETEGIVADQQIYRGNAYNELRENPARFKAWLNIFFKTNPKYLGDPIPIIGDGRKSWD